MDPRPGHIDAQGAHIDKLTQVNVAHNEGGVSVPVVLPAGRAVVTIDSYPSLQGADNLADAGASKNDAFVGRVTQLNDLAALLNDSKGPRAIAIVAGAGFGKTELAKEFINARARPAATGADPAALAVDQWTGRWWLDGSKGGEAPSLKKHYKAITGEPFPEEPKPAPHEDAAAVFAAWRSSLRRHIGQACSAGRQLLVIDNAETPAQIAECRPANLGRLIATTRRQPIPKPTAHEFALDVMSADDARAMLAASRDDLQDSRHAPALDAIAEHLGHHALALAYAAAALARPPHQSPQAVLARMKQTDIGDEADLLGEFDEQDLGGAYKLGLAQSLGLLLDELAEKGSKDHDPLAVRLAEVAAFCNPSAIPVRLFVDATGKKQPAVEPSLRSLHERSILTLTTTASLHRLTQSLVRGRLKRRGAGQTAAVLQRLLDALIELFADAKDHMLSARRTAAIPHAESVISFAESPTHAGELGQRAARLRADLAVHLLQMGQLASATRHIDAAIVWGEAQSPRDERSLAIDYASRASIRQQRGDLTGAEADIQKSIDWGESQSPRDERGLAIWYASRASIRRDLKQYAAARADIDAALKWWRANQPGDERGIGILRQTKASIDAAMGK